MIEPVEETDSLPRAWRLSPVGDWAVTAGFYPVRAAYFRLKRLYDFRPRERVCPERVELNTFRCKPFQGQN